MKNQFKITVYSVLCCLCMFTFYSGYGQEQETTGSGLLAPSFGIRGGINFSNLYVDNVADQNVKTGIVIGLYAKLPLTTGISFQPELLYSNKGAQLTYANIIQGQGVYRFNLNYIEAPMTLSFNIIRNFNLHAGGYVAYLASANVKNVRDGTIIGVTELNEDNFNRLDFGLVGGLGVDIGKFGIGARYNYGLNEVGRSGSLAGDLTENSKNSTLSLFVAFGF